MQETLNKIRIPDKNLKLKNKILSTFLIFLFGVVLGIFSKWLDNLSINDSIWWQHILGMLDLSNIFSSFGIWLLIAISISVFSKTPRRASINVLLFFLGMTVSYHLYTIFFSGFNPIKYMMIWYGFTLISPLLAYICWYAKSKSKISMLISSLILSVMFISSFNIGIWYFDLKSVIDLLIFIGTVIVLYVSPKDTIYCLFISIILAFVICGIVTYISI
ncbi:MAG: hypothetical protein Q4C33_03245 [bacterium]|nr:hypothetical protein [bacterium]